MPNRKLIMHIETTKKQKNRSLDIHFVLPKEKYLLSKVKKLLEFIPDKIEVSLKCSRSFSIFDLFKTSRQIMEEEENFLEYNAS